MFSQSCGAADRDHGAIEGTEIEVARVDSMRQEDPPRLQAALLLFLLFCPCRRRAVITQHTHTLARTPGSGLLCSYLGVRFFRSGDPSFFALIVGFSGRNENALFCVEIKARHMTASPAEGQKLIRNLTLVPINERQSHRDNCCTGRIVCGTCYAWRKIRLGTS